jgi:hypothetical protein
MPTPGDERLTTTVRRTDLPTARLPAPDDERGETDAERIDRNLAELLQEVRVAIIGAQVLFGFLLAIPFANRFDELDHADRVLFSIDLTLAATATAFLVGPVAYHRLQFRKHAKASVLRAANAAAIAGLVTIGLAMAGAVLLVMDFVWGRPLAWLFALPPTVTILVLWFAIPAQKHRPDHY